MKKEKWPAVFAGIGLLLLILDTKTALTGGAAGIEICLQTLIPSLFPFLFLSVLLTASLSGKKIRFLKPIGQLLQIPAGSESILLIGLLGGYPVGAQCIAQQVRLGNISRENGKRMLSFCSNAGPAFLFGIGCRLFDAIWMCWTLWGIHILAALLVGLLMPVGSAEAAKPTANAAPTVTSALRQALQIMATICGWVMLFRILLAFCERWFLWAFPTWLQASLCGLLELANGCCSLLLVQDTALRFVLCAGMLGFGGLCVTMQTFSVCDGVDTAWYLPGKLLQALFSVLLAGMVISREIRLPAGTVFAAIIGCRLIIQRKAAKKDSILPKYVVS